MQINNPENANDYYASAGNLRSGNRVTRTLLTGEEGTPHNYKFNYGGGGDSGDWTTPRHRHNFEQVRHPIAGDYVIAKNQVLPAGWVAYFPESAYYGPQVKSGNLTMLSLQFGGPSGIGYWSVAQRKRGYEELVEKGEFHEGIFTWRDEQGRKHNQDAAQAVWEQVFGRKIEYASPRDPEFIMMDPAAFDWRKDDEAKGVAWKRLGTFTERELKIALIQLDKGAAISLGREKSNEILFLKEGRISQGGQDFGRLTAFSTTAEERPETFTASEDCELFYVKLPSF